MRFFFIGLLLSCCALAQVATTAPITGDGTGGDPIGCQAASGSQGGCLTPLAQDVGGQKTFVDGMCLASGICFAADGFGGVNFSALYVNLTSAVIEDALLVSGTDANSPTYSHVWIASSGGGFQHRPGVASTDFPDCRSLSGSYVGSLWFDGDAGVFRSCDGKQFEWPAVATANQVEGTLSAFDPGLSSSAQLGVTHFNTARVAGSDLTFTVVYPGTDAFHSFTVSVNDATTSSTLCSRTRPCNTASWDQACSGTTDAIGDAVEVRVDASACVGTSPAGNIIWAYTLAAP